MSAVPPSWKRVPERGSVAGIRLLVALDRLLGRSLTGLVLWGVAAYYALVSPVARAASRELLARTGRPTHLGEVVRHLWMFARVALDRAHFATGRLDGFTFTHEGHEHIMATSGALVLGAHLGSFEALQALSARHGKGVTVLADERNARRLRAVLDRLAPVSTVEVVALAEDDPTAVLAVQAAVARGRLVAVLADRLTARAEHSVEVSFLGGRARLPTGPYVLAHALGCPVLFACALFTPPRSYALICEPFAGRVLLPRTERAAAVEGLAQRYASTVERHLRRAPLNWFNFFPFWEPPP